MSNNKQKILIRTAREATGKLIYNLISGVISPREAIKFFPRNVDDVSLKIAWHALLHYDADEDIRIKDSEYAQEQLKYLEMLSSVLSTGEELPKNMLEEYEKLYIDTILPKNYNWWGNLKSIFRFLE